MVWAKLFQKIKIQREKTDLKDKTRKKPIPVQSWGRIADRDWTARRFYHSAKDRVRSSSRGSYTHGKRSALLKQNLLWMISGNTYTSVVSNVFSLSVLSVDTLGWIARSLKRTERRVFCKILKISANKRKNTEYRPSMTHCAIVVKFFLLPSSIHVCKAPTPSHCTPSSSKPWVNSWPK